MDFHIDFQAFLDSLPIMGMGMLGIFVVIFVVFLLIMALNSATGKKGKDS
ncbi:MAG TPA: hypothetical protein IAA84_03755 [Candidatus Alectryocaccomicrobium excrementavium]|uniref:Oxaloacetate decarboxylase n=1 Tax=Candidatus Alectryocaccomicrobium excrementavium TaxID=2840668 RepID=A0A9D1K5Z2_9FIRM|nr:hypothetical protein [Candidatus Alectryocaccomicrobium excrementavium]